MQRSCVYLYSLLSSNHFRNLKVRRREILHLNASRNDSWPYWCDVVRHVHFISFMKKRITLNVGFVT